MTTFISKDQNWQDETTIYWFDVEGEIFGVADCNGEITYLNCDGCPQHDNFRNGEDALFNPEVELELTSETIML